MTIIIAILIFFAICYLHDIDEKLSILNRNQNEIIRVLKNKK